MAIKPGPLRWWPCQARSGLSLPLALEEVVTERAPPRRKVWETIGQPKLFVIGSYRMGFEIEPEAPPGRSLGRLFSRYYARWCTSRMVNEAATRFAASNHADQ